MLFLLVSIIACGPQVDEAYRAQLSTERIQENETFFNPETSPLDSAELLHFGGLKYFPIDEQWKVKASLERFQNQDTFSLPHSHERTKPYRRYGKVKFTLLNTACELIVLESANKKPGYENYLLVCFRDQSSGKTTYEAGRYLDITIPEGNEVELDFNKAYNPYCAYSDRFTCPIPPKENFIPLAVEAGVKYSGEH
ncbi:MAG: DUF1684 domain-containing protein [Bacteroidia bacterium]|nr:DUF1684 domain-containing protein [Bacteroidia bacterium]